MFHTICHLFCTARGESEILNGTSAQLGYTVPFTLVHAGKYRTEDKLKTDTLPKTKQNQEKAHNAKYSRTTLV